MLRSKVKFENLKTKWIWGNNNSTFFLKSLNFFIEICFNDDYLKLLLFGAFKKKKYLTLKYVKKIFLLKL